jgi:hypothetical protein
MKNIIIIIIFFSEEIKERLTPKKSFWLQKIYIYIQVKDMVMISNDSNCYNFLYYKKIDSKYDDSSILLFFNLLNFAI